LLATTNAAAAELAGQAHLNRGWGYWLLGTNAPALVDFRAATQQLPPSEDLAVAKFKLGDAQFALADFSGARESYQSVLKEFAGWPTVMQTLGDRTLYQLVRANLELKDNAGAERAMQQLLKQFPKSELADNGLLLLGEGLADFGSPTNAVAVLREFEQRFPESPLRPQVELALAQTFERAQDWPSVVASYQQWLANFPTNTLRPQVEYALGCADFQAGNEANALARFSGFVTQFPTNLLAPRAQWWVADHYFRAGNWTGAETNYELIFQTPAWKNSELFYPAQLMAARAAAGRLGFQDARTYLEKLVGDAGCPPLLATQAKFAYGSVLMRMDVTDTNRPFANFEQAATVFTQLAQANPTNEVGALAWSELGDCSLQLGAFDAATNAYTQVINSPSASAGLRCRAQIGIGRVLEKKAESAPAGERKALLAAARDNYWDAFGMGTGNALRDGESADAFWVKKAGLLTLPLLSTGDNYPTNFFADMETLLPPLKEMLEKKRAALKN
jgi:TolA-binding protein